MVFVSLQRDMRRFEEFDEFAHERFMLLPLTTSVSEINSLTRRLMRMSQRRFAYDYTRRLSRESLLCMRHNAINRTRAYFLTGE
jgi:hypothetical protein